MNILAVDDEQIQVETIRRGLQSRGHKVFCATSTGEALEMMESKEIDLVLTDYLMEGDTGLELLKKIRASYSTIPVILMTAFSEKKLLIDALHHRCNGFIDKPFTLDELMKEIELAEINIWQNTTSERLSKMLPRLVHHASNPLMSILASAEMAGKKSKNEQDLKKYIDNIIEGVMQIKEINMKIACLDHPAEERMESINLKTVLDSSLEMFMSLFSLKGIKCVEEGLEDLDVKIQGNRFDLEQVFNNLFLNAVEAMDGSPHKKRLTVSTIKEPSSSLISVKIRDTGCGIPDDQEEKIFKSNFTTKPHGTGLGLHIVRMIVEKHGGKVCVQSKQGAGAEFTVTLQVLVNKPEQQF